jgi:hypothetical protein
VCGYCWVFEGIAVEMVTKHCNTCTCEYQEKIPGTVGQIPVDTLHEPLPLQLTTTIGEDGNLYRGVVIGDEED